MSELTKQALKVENNQSFPNNNAGLITPTALRGFNEDMIDSTVNQQVYTTDSASFDTRIDSLTAFTGSFPTSGSFATTGSNTFRGTQTIVDTTGLQIKADNSETDFITIKSGTNILGLGRIDGVQVFNLGKAYLRLADTATTEAASLTSLFTTYQDGRVSIGVAPVDSALSRPNQLVVFNDKINLNVDSIVASGSITSSLQEGFVLVGNSSGRTQAVSTGSFGGGVIPSGTISGSSQVILQETTGNLSGSRIDGLVPSASLAISSSHSEFADNATSASFAVSSSHSEFADNSLSSSYAVSSSHSEFSDNATSASYALSASHAELADNATNSTFSIYSDNTIVYGKNVSGISIPKGTPLYFTGSGTGGNLVGVIPADAGNPLLMPAGGVAGETLGVGVEGIVLLDGFINGVNTNAFLPGQTVYVGVGGGYTNVKPTGSNNLIQALGYVEKAAVNGSGVIKGSGRANDVPNIQEGYAWVGNSNGVAVPSTTQSIVEHIFTQDNTFTGTQNFTNIAVSGTGSFGFIQSVTGSAKVIGDAFIVLNNDTPTERYAGLIVIDSGSTLASASFQFDGLTNDWFYEYTSALDADNFGVVLFGPEYGVKGSPIYPTNNRIQKGDGGHHILDSNISDDGSKVSINSNTDITGSLSVNGEGVITESDLNSLNNFTQSADSRLTNLESTTASLQTEVDGLSNATSSYALSASVAAVDEAQQLQIDSLISATGSYITSSVDITSLNAFTASQIDLNGTFATTGSNTFVGDQLINGKSTQTFNAPATDTQNDVVVVNGANIDGTAYTNVFFGMQDYPGSGDQFKDAFVFDYWTDFTYSTGSEFIISPKRIGGNMALSGSSPGVSRIGISQLRDLGGKTFLNQYANIINIGSFAAATTDLIFIGHNQLPVLRISSLNNEITGSTIISGSTSITGSLSVSGSINNSVNTLTITSNTASIDASIGNTFQLNLVSGSNTRLEVSNVKSGQTINLLVSQSNPFGGTLTLAGNLLEPSGSEYSASLVNGAQDILTLASFVRTDVMYVANINNLI